MTLEDLRAFVAAYQAESLSEAARRLGCTQAAVAQHVRRLERELGTELFSRVPRGVIPTELGRILYEGASSALGNLEMAIREIEHSLQDMEGRVRLAASATGVAEIFRPAVLALKKRRPGVLVEIETESTAEGRLRALREGRADLAFLPLTDPIRGLEVRDVTELELLVLVHRDHRFASRKALRPADLASLRYIAQGPASATFRYVERSLREAGVAFEPSQIVEDATTAILMVELGRGETFVTSGQAEKVELSGLVKTVPVPWLPPIPVGWAARNFSLLPEAARDFLDEFDRLIHAAG